MENLNAEQVKKELDYQLHLANFVSSDVRISRKCAQFVLQYIKELTDENKKLSELATTKEVEKEIVRKQTKTDTVREILAKVKERAYYDTTETGITHMVIGTDDIDEIAKELIGE